MAMCHGAVHTANGQRLRYCRRPSDFYRLVDEAFLGLHRHWYSKNTPVKPAPWALRVASVALYDSLAFFTLADPGRLNRVTRPVPKRPGSSIPYS
mmetsp:Transcript_3187/g.10544  ORF Transcript_3187/g.10544 Transcript_3187/m.10544 type:complete len:95 (-) Transcript_3187:1018-1302(-)